MLWCTWVSCFVFFNKSSEISLCLLSSRRSLHYPIHVLSYPTSPFGCCSTNVCVLCLSFVPAARGLPPGRCLEGLPQSVHPVSLFCSTVFVSIFVSWRWSRWDLMFSKVESVLWCFVSIRRKMFNYLFTADVISGRADVF